MVPEPTVPTLRLSLSSGDISGEDERWQRECQSLFTRIQRSLDAGDIMPARKAVGPSKRGAYLEIFNALMATGISLGGFKAIFELCKLWLEQRQNCEVTLTFPDGTQAKVSKLSYDQALKIREEHSRHFGGKKRKS